MGCLLGDALPLGQPGERSQAGTNTLPLHIQLVSPRNTTDSYTADMTRKVVKRALYYLACHVTRLVLMRSGRRSAGSRANHPVEFQGS